MEQELSDGEAVARFDKEGHWGLELLLNLYGCDVSMISDKETMKKFVVDLCDFIDMKRFGDTTIDKFGEGELYGFSFVQLIYTSSIVGHCVEKNGDVYLDIFSCKAFPPKRTEQYCKDYLKARESKSQFTYR
jgi:S-adenosylmethionine/arginine decarboxylase-like enzyme